MMVGQARPPNSSEVVSLFGIAADQQHLLALLRHHVGEVGEREALADAALAVDRDDLRRLRRLRRNRIGLDRGLGAQEMGRRIREFRGGQEAVVEAHEHALSSPGSSSGRRDR